MTVSDLPAVHGLRLGMSRREVELNFSIAPPASTYRGSAKHEIKNLEGIWFDFFAESLSVVEFDYDRHTEWKTIGEFAASLERSLNLPSDSWVFIDRTEATMTCDGFDISLSSVRNTLSLTDTFARNAIRNGASRARRRIVVN